MTCWGCKSFLLCERVPLGNAIAVRSFNCWDVVVVVFVVIVVVFCDWVRRGYPITFGCLKNRLLISVVKISKYLLVDGQVIV